MVLLYTQSVNVISTLLVLLLAISVYVAVRSVRKGYTLRTIITIGITLVLLFAAGFFFLFIYLFAPGY